MIGQTFHKLTVVAFSHVCNRHTYFVCNCECGNTIAVRKSSLLSGNTKSCGCLKPKHGYHQSPTWITWRCMLRRCTYKKDKDYHRYGGKGIKVIKRWFIFTNFLADMGERPEGKTLDRKRNDKNYCKSNCRWATPYEQTHNRGVKSTTLDSWKPVLNDNDVCF